MSQDDRPTIQSDQGGGKPEETAHVENTAASLPPTFPTQPVSDFSPQPGREQRTVMLDQPPAIGAWLAPVNGIRAGRLFPVDPSGTIVGRDAQSDIVLDDSAVSRQHAKLRREPGSRKHTEQFYIYDLGSSNGTFVNGQKIARQALSDGDKIRVGETVLVFKTIDAPPASPNKTKRAQKARKAMKAETASEKAQ